MTGSSDDPAAPAGVGHGVRRGRARRAGLAVALAGSVALVLGGLASGRQPRQPLAEAGPGGAGTAKGVIDLQADFTAGEQSPFNAFECGDVAQQFRLDPSITRGGQPSARFEERPGDVWTENGTIRCLAADYNSGEQNGDDFYYGFSLYEPRGAVNAGNLIWELHQAESLYRYQACSVAPYAVQFERTRGGSEGLYFRVDGGNCNPSRGWTLLHPGIPLQGLVPIPRDTWIDLMVHIRFSEAPTGVVEVWDRIAGQPWQPQPSIALRNISTVPHCDVCGVHDSPLYTELGLYNGSSSTAVDSIVYLDGYRRGTTLAVVRRGFPGP